MYIVQLYKEDWTILHMLGYRAVALPSTEQIAYDLQLRDYVSIFCVCKYFTMGGTYWATRGENE